MQITLSECLFENFCKQKGVRFHRIDVGLSQTPDYEIFLPRRKVIAEVKEITPNPTERAAEADMLRRHTQSVSIIPGERIRGKISDACKQIKSHTKSRYPGLLILFDRGLAVGHVDPYQIRVAMYGFETIVLALPSDYNGSPYPIERKYGPRRKMTTSHNTSISAVAMLCTHAKEQIELTVYHNIHAAVPLPYNLLAQYGIPQFTLAEQRPYNVADWVQVN